MRSHVPAQDLYPRDPDEWQGMRVDVSMLQVECRTSEQCGMAMRCHDGRCWPCQADTDCASDEACVLEHCLRSSAVHCRSRRDCGAEMLCVLSGYSADPRGNADMSADCVRSTGGRPQVEDGEERVGVAAPLPPVLAEDLLAALRKHLAK
jgi:hypothetical protein